MTKKIKIYIILFIYLVSFMFFADLADAASLYFRGDQSVKVGQSFIVQAVIAPEEKSINAIEGKIIFDSERLALKDISTGSSIISFWIQEPKPNESGVVEFAGIIPGGFSIGEGKVIDLTFRAKTSGQTLIFLEDYQAFLNEADLNQADVKTEPFLLEIRQATPGSDLFKEDALILDFYPPEPFKIHIIKNKELVDDKYVAIFYAQDKESGIDYYEIKEIFLGISGEWEKAESPYPLQYQSLFSIIRVRALDKLGRERVETIVPNQFRYLIVVVLLVFTFLLSTILKKTLGIQWRKLIK